MEDNIIILNDENDNEVEFEFLDLIDYNGDEFVILLTTEEVNDEAGEVVILLVESIDTEEESFSSVEDEQVLDAVFQIFKERNQADFNFVD